MCHILTIINDKKDSFNFLFNDSRNNSTFHKVKKKADVEIFEKNPPSAFILLLTLYSIRINANQGLKVPLDTKNWKYNINMKA